MGCTIAKVNKSIIKAPEKLATRQLSITPGTFVRMSTLVSISDYSEQRKLGSGAFAEVVLCFHHPTRTNRALKIIHKAGITIGQTDSTFLLKEIQILKNLDHPNILKCFEIFQDSRNFYVATEFCPAGDLFGEIVKMKKFTERHASQVMFQLLSALIYCHDKRVIHRDLKPENILLMENGESLSIKVADFGSSCVLDPHLKLNGCYGSAYYLAPEVFKGSYDEKCDIWSIGIIMYILLTGRPPYNGKDSASIIKKVKTTPFVLSNEKTIGLSKSSIDLLQQFLSLRPFQRISAREAIKHPWIISYRNGEHPDIELVLSSLKEFNCQSKLKEAVHIFLAAQVVSHEDIKAYKKCFQSIDKDGDGKITKEELIQEYCKNMTTEEAEKLAQEIIEKLDQDQDGNIDYTEFLVSCTEKERNLSLENLEVAFNMFDLDGSGTITVDEIKAVLDDGQINDDNTWREILKEADTNGDGCIDLKEFIHLMNSFKAKVQN